MRRRASDSSALFASSAAVARAAEAAAAAAATQAAKAAHVASSSSFAAAKATLDAWKPLEFSRASSLRSSSGNGTAVSPVSLPSPSSSPSPSPSPSPALLGSDSRSASEVARSWSHTRWQDGIYSYSMPPSGGFSVAALPAGAMFRHGSSKARRGSANGALDSRADAAVAAAAATTGGKPRRATTTAGQKSCSRLLKLRHARSASAGSVDVTTTRSGLHGFKCCECGKNFTSDEHSKYKQHVKRHRHLRSHVCQVCGKGFTRTSDLSTHMRTRE